MKLFKPQLQLAKISERQADRSYRDHYYLHVVTFTDQCNYRSSDEDTVVDKSKLNSERVIQVNLYIYQDLQTIDFNYLTPVVNTIDLGTPVQNEVNFIVQVDVFRELPGRNGSGGTSSGSGQTSSGGADEPDRPIGN